MAREVKVIAKGVQKKEPDLRKLSRALIQLAMAQEQEQQSAEQSNAEVAAEEAS
jgi:hypothetical protein